MIIVTAFHHIDAAQAASMFDWMADLCGQQNRTVILAHEELTPSGDVQRAASRAFAKVEHLLVTACANAWPISANCYFGGVAAAMRGREPWLWMEPDCVLTHPQGIDLLEADHARSGKAHSGTRIPAFYNKHGVWTQMGEMLCGVAIYSPGLWDASPLLRALRATQNAYAAAKAIPKAFDCYLAPEILPQSGSTPLIQHMGRSREFQRTGGAILCKYGPEGRWNPMIQPQTVLVHGVKDGSLIALLRAELKLPVAALQIPVIEPAKFIQPAKPPAPVFEWGAAAKLPPEEKPAQPPPRPAQPVAAPVPFAAHVEKIAPTPVTMSDPASVAMLVTARQSVQHWPDCKAHRFVLQEARGRHRVACECGACSPKLPEGTDWEAAWNAGALAGAATAQIISPGGSALSSVIEAAPAQPAGKSAPKAESAEALETPTPLPSPNGRLLPTINTRAAASEPVPEPPPLSTGKKRPNPHLQAKLNPSKNLLLKRSLLAQHPEWADYTDLQWRQRLNAARKKLRTAELRPLKARLTAASGRLLTSQARARKIELLNICKGHHNAFGDLKAIAVSRGCRLTKTLKKHQIIAAIIEKEFEQPYEEFEEVEK